MTRRFCVTRCSIAAAFRDICGEPVADDGAQCDVAGLKAAAIPIDVSVLLDAPTGHPRAYPVETVEVEKLEALVTRGIANGCT
jgi:hypothetical protein